MGPAKTLSAATCVTVTQVSTEPTVNTVCDSTSSFCKKKVCKRVDWAPLSNVFEVCFVLNDDEIIDCVIELNAFCFHTSAQIVKYANHGNFSS